MGADKHGSTASVNATHSTRWEQTDGVFECHVNNRLFQPCIAVHGVRRSVVLLTLVLLMFYEFESVLFSVHQPLLLWHPLLILHPKRAGFQQVFVKI